MEEAQGLSPAGAEEVRAAESVPAEAAAEAEGDADANARREAFEGLIRGEYKAEFDERVRRIIDRRFRDLKRLEAQAERAKPLFQLLEKRYGGENARPRERAAADLARRWQLDARMAKEIYPGFDLKAMLGSGRFTALLRAGVDVKTAYEVVNGRTLVADAMRYAIGRAREKTIGDIRARLNRPQENGAGGGGATRIGPMRVKDMTKRQREEIERRCARGEKVFFD